jgi:L-ribulose-5-phosphate 4-epimerase
VADPGAAAVLAAAAELDGRGLLSASGHGNISVRIPDADEIWYTAHPSLRTVTGAQLARIALDGTVRAGTVPPLSMAAARMHLAVYRQRPDVGSVLHTHSAASTAYAVAGRRIDCWAEPLDIFGMSAGIPVTPYAVRGSAEAVELVRETCADLATRAMLLGNHGLLAYGADPQDAVHVATLVEEAAQLGLAAAVLGGALLLPDKPGGG